MTVSVNGLNEIINSIQIKPKVKRDILKAAGDVMLATVLKFTPKDTGKYAAGWRVEIKGNMVSLWNRDRTLFLFLEYGTKDHEIKPRNGRAIKTSAGDYYARVQVSGITPRPHLRKAVQVIKMVLPKIVMAKIALNSKFLSHLASDKYPERKYTGSGNNRLNSNSSTPNSGGSGYN